MRARRSLSSGPVERGLDLVSLPHTRSEVEGIARLFDPGSRILVLGNENTEERVKQSRLDQFRYVHFAAHSFVDEEKPLRSGIVLSPGESEDGVLQMDEVMQIDLNADLVRQGAVCGPTKAFECCYEPLTLPASGGSVRGSVVCLPDDQNQPPNPESRIPIFSFAGPQPALA